MYICAYTKSKWKNSLIADDLSYNVYQRECEYIKQLFLWKSNITPTDLK